MKIIQIVGYKNSGKTTLSSQVIAYFSRKRLRVASVKHHGHGGVPQGLNSTDSEKHKEAGALLSGVEGAGLLQLSKEQWTLDEILDLYRYMKMELTVIEGFKEYPYPKVRLIREEEDLRLLDRMENVIAIYSRIPIKEEQYPYPIFYRVEKDVLCRWLESQLTSKNWDVINMNH